MSELREKLFNLVIGNKQGYMLIDEILNLIKEEGCLLPEEHQIDMQMLGESLTDKYEAKIAEAKREVAREIFGEIDKLPIGLRQHTLGVDHYDDKGNEVMLHQSDCLKCKYEKVKSRYLGKSNKGGGLINDKG